MFGRFALASLALLFCAPAEAAEVGELSIFSDQVGFAINAPAPMQGAKGYFGGGSISGLYPLDEPGHMLLVTPPGDAVVGRHVDLPLSSLPFLTWNWRRLPTDMGQPETLTNEAPMRLIVGFSGGSPHPTLSPPPPTGKPTASLPSYERAVVVTWSNQPWESGATDHKGSLGRFVAHGGPADGQWWQQAVDLADLHSRLWPEVATAQVHVAWVAVAIRKSEGRSLGEISGVTLAP